MTIDQLIDEAVSRGLVDLQLRISVGGWQAIAKYQDRQNGPWDVGVSEDPVTALRDALTKQQDNGVFD